MDRKPARYYTKIGARTVNSNEAFILIGIFGLGFFLGNGVLDKKPTPLVIDHIVIQKPINTDDFLTVDDLKNIYACVDTKIINQNNKVKFPCVSVRGDSF